MSYYLAPYIGSGTREDPCRPRGSDQPGWSSIDLRPDGGRTSGESGLNACLLHLPIEDPDSRLQLLGIDPDDTLGIITVRTLNSRLCTAYAPGRLQDVFAHVMSRPPANGWNPLVAGVDHPREIWLGGLLWRETIAGGSDPVWTQLKYWQRLMPTQRYLYDHYTASGASPWLAFRLARRQLWPICGGALPASDNFNRADENPLSNGGKWTTPVTSEFALKVQTNTARTTSSGDRNSAWWNADTFNGDHYSQVVIVNFAAGGQNSGPTIRVQSAAQTYYHANFSSANTNNIAKTVSGTETLVKTTNITFAVGDTGKLDASGSTLRIYDNGVQGDSATDTSITGGAAGIRTRGDASSGFLDDWQGDNVAAAGGTGVISTGGATLNTGLRIPILARFP